MQKKRDSAKSFLRRSLNLFENILEKQPLSRRFAKRWLLFCVKKGAKAYFFALWKRLPRHPYFVRCTHALPLVQWLWGRGQHRKKHIGDGRNPRKRKEVYAEKEKKGWLFAVSSFSFGSLRRLGFAFLGTKRVDHAEQDQCDSCRGI